MQLFKSPRRLILIGIDFLIMVSTFAFTVALTVLSRLPYEFNITEYLFAFLIFSVMIFAGRCVTKIYSNVWRYANSRAYLEIVLSDYAGGALALIITYLFLRSYAYIGVWRSVAFVSVNISVTLASRFIYQQKYRHNNLSEIGKAPTNKINVAIIGAGQVGALLAEELLYNQNSHYKPTCFVDSDVAKAGSRVLGLPVYLEDDGIINRIKGMAVQEIFIAVPSLDGESLQAIHSFYLGTGCKVKIYEAALTESGTGKHTVREIKIEDLLFRNAVSVADERAKEYYRDKVILVTGGGGSIGSELCRKIAKCSPKRLIIFDIYENNAYDIQQELLRKYGTSLDLSVEIGSVRDRARLEAVFAYYRPQVIFHAAAHKHVPLMEHSNAEAIKNNVLGTYNTADMAEKYGAERFTLVSTDKAVNPTNVMGASKRLCEMVILSRVDSKTVFGAVRFGNVLGSNGSVIPLFRRQIEGGGPVTVTDKRIIRYFMTIPEAAGLVMQAGAMAKCGELFVLDMGKPVKIIELAENMIRISGYRPYEDIEIIETGLRPGEKLYEELLVKTEKLTKTPNDMIFIEEDTPPTREEVEEKLAILRAAVKECEGEIAAARITEAMKSVVPTFRSPEEVNRCASEAAEMKEVVTSS